MCKGKSAHQRQGRPANKHMHAKTRTLEPAGARVRSGCRHERAALPHQERGRADGAAVDEAEGRHGDVEGIDRAGGLVGEQDEPVDGV